jgi:hypothetical protein
MDHSLIMSLFFNPSILLHKEVALGRISVTRLLYYRAAVQLRKKPSFEEYIKS